MEFFKNAAFAAGVTLTGQIGDANVLNLITKLKPQNCRKDQIRVGSQLDGGYLLLDDLEVCFELFGGRIGSDYCSLLVSLLESVNPFVDPKPPPPAFAREWIPSGLIPICPSEIAAGSSGCL